MQNVKRLISMAAILTLFMLIVLCVATKSARSWIDTPSQAPIEKDTKKGICTIKCINNTKHLLTFQIEWIDHPFLHQTRGAPWSLAMGEINPGESWKLTEYGYLPGWYRVTCYPTRVPPFSLLHKLRASEKFTIKPYVSKVTITTLIIEDKLEIFLIYGHGL